MDYTGYKVVKLSNTEMADFYANKTNLFELVENEYLVIQNSDEEVVDKFCFQEEAFKPVRFKAIKSAILGDIKPRNLEQELAFNMLQDSKTKIKVLTGPYGSGKAQPNSIPVPTPFGWTTMGELRKGDYVFDRFGKPTLVLETFPQGKKKVFKIILADGRETLCCENHLWTTYTSKDNFITKTTREMFNNGTCTKAGAYRYQIPMNKAIEYAAKDFAIDPYVMGVFLGDGCCLERDLTLSSQDEEILQEVARLTGFTYHKESLNNYSWVFRKNGVRVKTREFFKDYPEVIDYAINKKIPEQYKYGSIEQRLNLLQGLLDTDGSIEPKGRVSFYSCSEQLANDVKELVYSLGMQSGIGIDKRPEKYSSDYGYSLSVSCPRKAKEKLFRLPRKKKRAESLPVPQRIRLVDRVSIVAIEELDYEEEMTCILVNNEEHLYLTNDYIVTHNTMSMLAQAVELLGKGIFEKIVYVRNNINVKDTVELGSLPGGVVDKLYPYLAPMADQLGSQIILDDYIEKGKIEPVHLGFLRGRDLRHSLIYCTEAQNLSVDHMKLLIGRVGEGSELWCDGDFAAQVDRTTFEKSNGLRTLVERLNGNEYFGYIRLRKSERSKVAALANLLD